MLKVISTTVLLSLSVLVNANASTHVQSFNALQPTAEQSMMLNHEEGLDPTIEKRIIELHVAPHWGLSIAEAWEYYHTGDIVIFEIEEGYVYEVEYTGGLLEIVFEDR